MVISRLLRQVLLPPLRDFMKQIPAIPTYLLDKVEAIYSAADALLQRMRLLKLESCCIEAFRLLKQADSLKRVVRREWTEVTSGNVKEDAILPQLVKEVRELLGMQR